MGVLFAQGIREWTEPKYVFLVSSTVFTSVGVFEEQVKVGPCKEGEVAMEASKAIKALPRYKGVTVDVVNHYLVTKEW